MVEKNTGVIARKTKFVHAAAFTREVNHICTFNYLASLADNCGLIIRDAECRGCIDRKCTTWNSEGV